jgi:hypothetical protein
MIGMTEKDARGIDVHPPVGPRGAALDLIAC